MELVGLAFLIAALVLGFSVLGLVLPLAWATIFAWGGGLAAAAALTWFYWQRLTGSQLTPEVLRTLVSARLADDKLALSVREKEVAEYVIGPMQDGKAVAVALAVMGAILYLQYHYTSAFYGHRFELLDVRTRLSSDVAAGLSAALSTLIIGVTLGLYKPSVFVTQAVTAHIRRMATGVSPSLTLIPAIRGEVSAIESGAARLGFAFRATYLDDLPALVEAKAADILRQPDLLNNEVNRILDEVRNFRQKLDETETAFAKFRVVTTKTSILVNEVGNAGMFTVLDETIRGVEAARDLIAQADFPELLRIINSGIVTLERLQVNAKRGPGVTIADLDPFEVIGVSRDMEFAVVKATYRKLIAVYHADLAGSERDQRHLHARAATINVAFEAIERHYQERAHG